VGDFGVRDVEPTQVSACRKSLGPDPQPK
jgi:hypothetical protein